MGAFAAAGGTYDRAMERAKRAAAAPLSDPDALLDFHDNLDTNNNLLNFISGEVASLRITVQDLKSEIEAIKLQMNMPTQMGGYMPTGATPVAFTPPPPKAPSLFSDDYSSHLRGEDAVDGMYI